MVRVNNTVLRHPRSRPSPPPHQAMSRVCCLRKVRRFSARYFFQKIWTAQNFGFFCRALTGKSALETAIATLSFMKVSASTPFFRLASKHCSAGPITRQKWSEGFRQRQNFGSLFFSSDVVTSHRNASVGMQFVGFTGREGFFRHRNLCLRPPHATDLDGFWARASKKIMAGVASLADDVELTEMCSAISNT